MIDPALFSSVQGPWLHHVSVLDLKSPELRSVLRSRTAIHFDGRKMRTLDALFEQYSIAFRFPAYFGANWPAFYECMTTLENSPARSYLCVIKNATELLSKDIVEKETYRRHVEDIGKYWSRSFALGPEWGGGEVPFHTVCVGE